MSTHDPESSGNQKPSITQVIGSALSAAFGVQSEKNRIRDFKAGSPREFIVAGVIATVLFILTIYTVVRLVLAFAGA
jgi:hypothetical protein